MDGIAYLITESHEKNSIGQFIPTESRIEIFVSVDNVSRSEWSAAGRNGFVPEYLLKTAAVNYSGESIAEFEGVRYSIYRTYWKMDTDEIELYLGKKAGV